MPRKPKYTLPNSGARRSDWPYWLGAVLLLAGFGWFWLRTEKAAAVRKPAPAAVRIRQTVSKPGQPPIANTKPATVVKPAVIPRTVNRHPPPTSTATTPPFPRSPRNLLETQVALARRVISPGSLDGRMGYQTRAALRVFQQELHLPQSGELDGDTRQRLLLESPAFATYVVSSNDMARLQPLAETWLGKSQQPALDYETILELIAEKHQTHPESLRTLNPGVNWSNLVAGAEVCVPDVEYPAPAGPAACIRISLASRTLQAFGAESNLIAHFPCSIARNVEKRPLGELHVAAIAPNPNYTFSPEVFPESAEAKTLGRKLILPPGPNNPVGIAWISLDRPGYGIHGTPGPEQVGRTESHGCFRLANWNAAYLLKLVSVGTPVFVEP